jgi:hypothetical protein
LSGKGAEYAHSHRSHAGAARGVSAHTAAAQ